MCSLGFIVDHCLSLIRWSLYKYKYVWGVRSKNRSSNFQEEVSYTYILKLD